MDDVVELKGFKPVYGKILILGSSVGKTSMERGFFYMDNANCFWEMLDEAFYSEQRFFTKLKEDFINKRDDSSRLIDKILIRLNENKVGLSDIFEKCFNKTSSKDSGIILDDEKYPYSYNNELKKLIDYADVIILNGKSNDPKRPSFTEKQFYRALSELNIDCSNKRIIPFYSTSGANNGKAKERLEQWKTLKDILTQK